MAKLKHLDYQKLASVLDARQFDADGRDVGAGVAYGKVTDDQVREDVARKLAALHAAPAAALDWKSFAMFWPPRLVKAVAADDCVGFFGAGLSIAAGAPAWGPLLREHLKLSPDFVEDADLQNDPLTLAEIAAQRLGSHVVQQVLRDLTSRLSKPTTGHVALAALRCPVYITPTTTTSLSGHGSWSRRRYSR